MCGEHPTAIQLEHLREALRDADNDPGGPLVAERCKEQIRLAIADLQAHHPPNDEAAA